MSHQHHVAHQTSTLYGPPSCYSWNWFQVDVCQASCTCSHICHHICPHMHHHHIPSYMSPYAPYVSSSKGPAPPCGCGPRLASFIWIERQLWETAIGEEVSGLSACGDAHSCPCIGSWRAPWRNGASYRPTSFRYSKALPCSGKEAFLCHTCDPLSGTAHQDRTSLSGTAHQDRTSLSGTAHQDLEHT